VLLIDDSELLLELVKASLAKRGIEAVTQSSPFGIERVVEARQPELVLLDVEMPLMGGAELCSLLKAHPSTCHLPVVFYSRLPEPELARLAAERGADAYLRKTSDLDDLADQVQALMGRFAARR
jgi:CheY-like chemotaxis protein